jgi:hypothetical protein
VFLSIPGDTWKADAAWTESTAVDGGYGFILICTVLGQDSTNNIGTSYTFSSRLWYQTTAIDHMVSSFGTSGNNAITQSFSTGTINTPLVDDLRYYEITVNITEAPGNGGENLRFYGCQLYYSVTSAS